MLQKELEQQEEKLAENEAIAAAELEEWGPQISQLQSEFKFLQARTFNESKEADTMARASVVKEILPVVDNFDRAKASLKAETDAEQAILDLYEGIFADINSVLESFDMQVIPSVGAEFDYNLHEAIQQMSSDEYEADFVCQEFQSECLCQQRVQGWAGGRGCELGHMALTARAANETHRRFKVPRHANPPPPKPHHRGLYNRGKSLETSHRRRFHWDWRVRTCLGLERLGHRRATVVFIKINILRSAVGCGIHCFCY